LHEALTPVNSIAEQRLVQSGKGPLRAFERDNKLLIMRTLETGNDDAGYLAKHLDRVARLDENGLEQLAKTLRTEEGEIDSCSYCKQSLICADVRCSLLPADVLFPGLKDHAECFLLSIESCSHADQSAR